MNLSDRVHPPQVVARRSVDLPHKRRLEIVAIEDASRAQVDVWLRLLAPTGWTVGQFHVPVAKVRELARALGELAGEVGCGP